MSSESRCAVVTGGGSGIGRATVCALARDGFAVLVVDVDEAAGSETVELASRSGAERIEFSAADLSYADQVRAVIEVAMQRFGRIDVLHSNAGRLRTRPAIEQVSDAEWQQLQDLLLLAPFAAAKAVFPIMRSQGGGLIVHTASRAAWTPLPWGLAYSAAKAGVLAFSRSLAVLGAPLGIRSNAICPGPVRTSLQQDLPDEQTRRLDLEGWVTPEDVAEVVRYFIRNTNATGEEVLVEVRDGAPAYLRPTPLEFGRFDIAGC